MKMSIDIEALLIWAYRDQCVDRVMSRARPKAPTLAQGAFLTYAALGTVVDTSRFDPSSMGLKLPDDAMIIHDAVLAAGEMWIEWLADGDLRIWDAVSAAAEHQIIERIDGRWLRRPVTPNGRVAAFGVVVEPACTTALLIVHAKAASRPEAHARWQPPPGRPATDAGRTDARGRPRKRRDGPTLDEVMRDRALYLVWRAGLQLLAAELAGALAKWETISPAAPALPWEMPLGREALNRLSA